MSGGLGLITAIFAARRAEIVLAPITVDDVEVGYSPESHGSFYRIPLDLDQAKHLHKSLGIAIEGMKAAIAKAEGK